MTLIVFLQPRHFLLYFHVCSFYSNSPEWLCQISRCGSFLPSYPLSRFGVVPGLCVSSIIPSSWNIGICGGELRLTDGCSAQEMEAIHRARKVVSGSTQTVNSSIMVSAWAFFTERTRLAQSDPNWVQILFVFPCGGGRWIHLRLISFIVLMWKKKKKKIPSSFRSE